MSKKLKLQIAHLQTEVDRITTLHTDLTNEHASLQAKHSALEYTANTHKSDADKQKEECTALKISLAQQENKLQDLQTTHATLQNDHNQLKEELVEAKLAAEESAEAAEAAAATATAAAAAAAAMAGGDSDSDSDDSDDENKNKKSSDNVETIQEAFEVEKSAMQEHIHSLRKDLKEEMKKRKSAEVRVKNLEDQQGLTSVSNQLRASEEAVHKSSSDLVAQAEKNLKLHDKVSKLRSKLQAAEESVATVRRALVGEVAGQDAEFELYEHVSFADLARLALQGKRNGVGSTDAGGEGKDTSGNTTLTTTTSGQSLDAIRKAEAEIKSLRAALRQAQSEVEVQRSIASKGKAAESSLQQLKEKSMELANRVAREKDRYVHQKDETRRRDDRIQALSDHIEKLMIHLKHEAASKAKAVDQQRRAGREVSH